jgi:hypothetical protein
VTRLYATLRESSKHDAVALCGNPRNT